MNLSPLHINVLLGLKSVIRHLTGKESAVDSNILLKNPILRLRIKSKNPAYKEIQIFATQEELIISAEGEIETEFAKYLQSVVLETVPFIQCHLSTPSTLQ